MLIFLLLITIVYILLIGSLLYGWKKIPETNLSGKNPKTQFSVIIPYRNEAENLTALLQSIANIEYPWGNFEIFLVNDASEDNSHEICSRFKEVHSEITIHLLENIRTSGSPKKDAITTAIKKANHEYILTTDADCILPTTWLQTFNEMVLDSKAHLIAGPVAFEKSFNGNGKRHLHNFQEIDLMSLQAAGVGGFGLDKAFMCNGANLCYQRSAFIEVEGFDGNNNISSGDDVFLLQKFSEKGFKLKYLKSKEAIVLTKPQPDLDSLLSQRIRWAAKTPAYKSNFGKLLGLAVLLMNFFLLAGGFLALFSYIPYEPVLIMFLLKFNLDFALIYQSATFFNRQEVLRNYFWSSIVYPFFSSYVAILSLFKGFEWKGRKFVK